MAAIAALVLSPILAFAFQGIHVVVACATPITAPNVVPGNFDDAGSSFGRFYQLNWSSVAGGSCGEFNTRVYLVISPTTTAGDKEPGGVVVSYNASASKYWIAGVAVMAVYYEYYGYYELVDVGVGNAGDASEGGAIWPCECKGFDLVGIEIKASPQIEGFNDTDSESVEVQSGIVEYTFKKVRFFCPDEERSYDVGGLIVYLDKSGYEGGRPR